MSLKSNLPKAKFYSVKIKIGNEVIRSQKPNQTTKQAVDSIKNLEQAAKDKVFISHAIFAE